VLGADELRRKTGAKINALPAVRRIELALELGEADAMVLATVRGISVNEARQTPEQTEANESDMINEPNAISDACTGD
jgi:hypothetical protein